MKWAILEWGNNNNINNKGWQLLSELEMWLAVKISRVQIQVPRYNVWDVFHLYFYYIHLKDGFKAKTIIFNNDKVNHYLA